MPDESNGACEIVTHRYLRDFNRLKFSNSIVDKSPSIQFIWSSLLCDILLISSLIFAGGVPSLRISSSTFFLRSWAWSLLFLMKPSRSGRVFPSIFFARHGNPILCAVSGLIFFESTSSCFQISSVKIWARTWTSWFVMRVVSLLTRPMISPCGMRGEPSFSSIRHHLLVFFAPALPSSVLFCHLESSHWVKNVSNG